MVQEIEDEDSDEIVKDDSDQENTDPIEETPCPPVDILIEPLIESPPIPIKPTDRDTEELPPLAPTSHKPDHLKYVQVNRSEEIELSRSKLPIIAEEQLIMETINIHNDLSIVS